MKREQLTNVTTESVDERFLHVLADRAFRLSKDFSQNEWMAYIDPAAQCARIANRIISLRSQQVTP
jgi:hypothetical protein